MRLGCWSVGSWFARGVRGVGVAALFGGWALHGIPLLGVCVCVCTLGVVSLGHRWPASCVCSSSRSLFPRSTFCGWRAC